MLDMKHHLSLIAMLITDVYELVAIQVQLATMDEGIVAPIGDSSLGAVSSNDISDNNYSFVVTLRPSGKTISLELRDIYEPDGSSAGLTTLSCTTLYAAANRKLNDLHVTPASHSLSDRSRYILSDDQLQKVLAFEGQYQKLFRFFLDPNQYAASSNDISDNGYCFIVTLKPSEKTISLKLPDIYEPDGSSMGLTTLRCTTLYAAVNRKINDLHITPASHSLSDSSRYILSDDHLQKILAFEGQYHKLFRFFLYPNQDAASSNGISDNGYAFVVTHRPSGRTVSLSLRDICEPDRSSMELATLSCTALCAAVNKKLNDLHVTPTSYYLSDSSKHFSNDDQLQEALAFMDNTKNSSAFF